MLTQDPQWSVQCAWEFDIDKLFEAIWILSSLPSSGVHVYNIIKYLGRWPPHPWTKSARSIHTVNPHDNNFERYLVCLDTDSYSIKGGHLDLWRFVGSCLLPSEVSMSWSEYLPASHIGPPWSSRQDGFNRTRWTGCFFAEALQMCFITVLTSTK